MTRLTVDDLKLARDGTLSYDPALVAKREKEWLAQQPGRFSVTVYGTLEIMIEKAVTVEVDADSEDDAKEKAEEMVRAKGLIDLDRWENDGTEHESYTAAGVERVA